MTTPDDAMTAYYRSMARNMVPAIYDLFYLFATKHDLNPYKAYLIGKFATDDEQLVDKPENQILQLKHFDNKEIIEAADEVMNSGELEKHDSEYKFVGTLMPLLKGTMLDEAKHLSCNLTEIYFVATLVKPEGKETYLRVKMKCYVRAGWSKLLIDGKI